MPTIDKEDMDLIINALIAHEEAVRNAAHPENFHQNGDPKIHTGAVKRRVVFVTIVIITMSVADHFVHLEWMFRSAEMLAASFFDWWFNVANKGELKVPKITLRRKTKQP